MPTAQLTQVAAKEAPTADEYLPAAHELQIVEPAVVTYCPATQAVHAFCPEDG